MPRVTIYHNPRCTKSRQTLKLIRDQGIEPEVVEYLQDPPDEATIEKLLKKLGMRASELVRRKDARALGLSDTEDDATWIRRMVQHPKIMERPIVVVGRKARLGRPPENVLEILPATKS